jgi:hypothetical protein
VSRHDRPLPSPPFAANAAARPQCRVSTDFMNLFETLNASGCSYVVVGGLALVLHGVGRTTTDVDVCLDFAADSLEAAIDTLTRSGYRPAVPVGARELDNPISRTRWQRDNQMVVFSLWDSNNRRPTLDIMLDPVVPFAQLWRDALLVPLFGTTVRIASIPHLIKLKEHSNRPLDRADIESLRRIAALKGNP